MNDATISSRPGRGPRTGEVARDSSAPVGGLMERLSSGDETLGHTGAPPPTPSIPPSTNSAPRTPSCRLAIRRFRDFAVRPTCSARVPRCKPSDSGPQMPIRLRSRNQRASNVRARSPHRYGDRPAASVHGFEPSLRRTIRPGASPVMSPSESTFTPFTSTYSTPSANRFG